MNAQNLNILHIVHTAGPASFGLGHVALSLAREQKRLENTANVWSLDPEPDRQWAASSLDVSINSLQGFPATPPRALLWSRQMEHAAREMMPEISIVHLHSLWTGLSRIPILLRKQGGIPSVVTPHGALEQWALKKSQWKKKIALLLYERANLANASCLYACSEQEVRSIRDFGLKNPIALIPNGVSDDWIASCGDAQIFRERYQIPQGKRILLFLSRISPIKGLPLLLEAVANLKDELADWHLVIAGADEFNHLLEIKRLIEIYRLFNRVTITGPLFDQDKKNAFSAAELFVLPTLSENFALVVIEALGSAIPVITTRGAPWEALNHYGCGWWTDINSFAIAQALREACACSQEHLHKMGVRGKLLVKKDFTWQQAAKKTIALYSWLLGRNGKPDFVV